MARPRTHPAGTTPADRKRVSRCALIESGGAIKQFALSPRGVENLTIIRAAAGATDTGVVERLLEDERNRLTSGPLADEAPDAVD